MLQSSTKSQSSSKNGTKVSKSYVEQLQKTIKHLEHENSELKLELEPSDFIYTSVIGYVENVVSKANPDIFDAYTENTSSSTLSTYSINVDTFLYPIEIDRWGLFSDNILHDMWENIMEAGQRGPLLRPAEALYDSSKTDNLKPPKSKQELSVILRETIEKPAARLINAVEQKLGSYPNTTCVWYQDHVPEQLESEASKAFAKSYPENAKMLDSTSHTQPDSCFFGYGKLVMAGLHLDPQSLNVSRYETFERLYERHKRDEKDFTDMLRELELETESDASFNEVTTVINIILIAYSLMVKYNLQYTYATTGRCWLILLKFYNDGGLYYDFFESNPYTEALGKCQSIDYQYLKQTAFVKVVCLALNYIIEYLKKDMRDTWLAKNAEPNASQDSGDSCSNAKQLYSTDEINVHSSTSHRPAKKQKTGHDQPSSDDGFLSNHYLPRPEYCTQKCLLGLKFNSPMHQECPNYVMHKKYSDSDLHPIKNTDLGLLFYRQLKKEIRSHIQIVHKEGKNGFIFKITVYPHGYTFIGKGVEWFNEGDLIREINVYNKLEKIQGEWVPVYLDCIRLSDNARIDRIDDGSPKTSLIMFLSYVGEDMNWSDVKVNDDEIDKLEGILRELGIWHNDVNLGNILWSKELNHAMLIDMGLVRELNYQ